MIVRGIIVSSLIPVCEAHLDKYFSIDRSILKVSHIEEPTMTYPTAPSQLKISWGGDTSFEFTAIAQRFDGGTDGRTTSSQINTVLQSRQIEANLSLADYAVVEGFLAANIGKPFYYESVLYVCDSYSWSVLSFGYLRLTAQLQEVVRP